MKRLFIIALIPMLLAGCQKQDEVAQVPTTEPEKTYVLANLALALPASPAGTRMTDDIVQVNGNFRGIQRLNIIPFLTRGKIGMHDRGLSVAWYFVVPDLWTFNDFHRQFDEGLQRFDADQDKWSEGGPAA